LPDCFQVSEKTPASLTPLGIMVNFIVQGATLAGMELTRARLVAGARGKNSVLIIGGAAILFTLLSIPLRQITGVKPGFEAIDPLFSNWLPLLAENLLATLLAFIAGAGASLSYRAILAGFWWFCPWLPNLDWAFLGLIGMGAPVLAAAVVSTVYNRGLNRGKPAKAIRRNQMPLSWLATALACVVVAWFVMGAFPLQPLLVGSGSMSPALNVGDIVLVAKMPADAVRVGDIVEYRKSAGVNVIHRVIETLDINSKTYFVTKGDGNADADSEPVAADNIVGRVILTVPKVGWAAIAIKGLFKGNG
jgi:signal peptidase I